MRLIGGIVPILVALALIVPASGAASVCNSVQIANQSNAALIHLLGNSGWASSYYTFNSFNATAVFYNPNRTLNKTGGYIILVRYASFSGPGGLKSAQPPTLTFAQTSNSPASCSKLVLWAAAGIVAPYNPSGLITASDAEGVARANGYQVNFASPSLSYAYNSPASSPLSAALRLPVFRFLAPGYIAFDGGYNIIVDAENGTFQRQRSSQSYSAFINSPFNSTKANSTPTTTLVQAAATTSVAQLPGGSPTNALIIIVMLFIAAIVILAAALYLWSRKKGGGAYSSPLPPPP